MIAIYHTPCSIKQDYVGIVKMYGRCVVEMASELKAVQSQSMVCREFLRRQAPRFEKIV